MSKYWKDRFIALEESRNKNSKQTYNQIVPAFEKAERQIQNQIDMWYQRFADNNGVSLQAARKLLTGDELKELKWDIQEYIKYGKENAFTAEWMTELENASAKYHISRLEALKLRTQQSLEVAFGNELDAVDGMLRHQFGDTYHHTCFEIMRGYNVGWDIGQIDERRLSTILSNPWAADGKTFSDRIWQSKRQMVNDLHQQMTRACILGKAPDETIRSLTKYLKDKTKNARYQAGRLVMTESTWIGSVAQEHAFKDLDVEEFEIVATLDSHTSDICQDMDGQHYSMKLYEVGVTAPPFHCFCRSCTAPYFDDEFSFGERAARDADGKTYYVPSNMTYKDWKKSFVDGGDKGALKVISNSGTMDLKSRIQVIKDSIVANGGVVTETHLKDAGKIIKSELETMRLPLKTNYENAKKIYDSFGYEQLVKLKKQYSLVNRSLMQPSEIGLKSVEESLQKYKETDRKISDLISTKEFNDAYAAMRDAEDAYKGSYDFNSKQLKDKLSEIRNMGSGTLDVKAHLSNSRSPMRKLVEKAYDCYPTEWVEKSVKRGNLKVKKVDRGYYSDWGNEIAISGWTDDMSFKTSLHELGHRFERAVPEIVDMERLFYDRRTDGEVLQWLGSGYSYSEKAKFDNFLDNYMGKYYSGDSFELVSMGFEYAYTKPTVLWNDEDMAEWIYGILTLL